MAVGRLKQKIYVRLPIWSDPSTLDVTMISALQTSHDLSLGEYENVNPVLVGKGSTVVKSYVQ